MQDMTLIVPKWLLLGNAMAAFALNLAVYLLIGKTSALTMNIAGERRRPFDTRHSPHNFAVVMCATSLLPSTPGRHAGIGCMTATVLCTSVAVINPH